MIDSMYGKCVPLEVTSKIGGDTPEGFADFFIKLRMPLNSNTRWVNDDVKQILGWNQIEWMLERIPSDTLTLMALQDRCPQSVLHELGNRKQEEQHEAQSVREE